MSEEVILDITTIEETVTIDTTDPEVIEIKVVAVTGASEWNQLEGTADKVPFTTTNGGPQALGELAWLASTESLALRLKNGENLDLGEETIYHVDNNTGSTIAKGAAVSYAGTAGASGKLRVKLWNGSTDLPEAFMGLAMGAIATGQTGYVTAFGVIRGVNTSEFSDGVILYANPAGTGLTSTKPTGTHVVAAVCINAGNNGTILVRPTIGGYVETTDPRLSDARTPLAHTHGNISNGGAIGTTNNMAVVTGASGVLTTRSRSGIDTRSDFPNADVTAATSLNTPDTLVKRGSGGEINVGTITAYEAIAISLNSGTDTLTLSAVVSEDQLILFPNASGTLLISGGSLNTPSSGVLTNCTGLPISTGVAGLGSGVDTFLATPTSANLAAAVTDETGSGSLVLANSPTLTSPSIAGTAQFTGTDRPTSAAVGSPAATDLITRADGDARYGQRDWFLLERSLWTSTAAQNGGALSEPFYVFSGNNTGVIGGARFSILAASFALMLWKPGSVVSTVNSASHGVGFFNDILQFEMKLWYVKASGTGLLRFASNILPGFSAPSYKTIGYEISGGNLRAFVHDGATLTYGTSYSMVAGLICILRMEYNPSERVLSVYVNNALASITPVNAGPTGNTSSGNQAIQWSAINNDGGAANESIGALQNVIARRLTA